uniref:Envelope glycoprotein n=1 Tax=Malurus cyaneus samueli TaxID=2593467 RepID=A0A8C5U1K3_9PASS
PVSDRASASWLLDELTVGQGQAVISWFMESPHALLKQGRERCGNPQTKIVPGSPNFTAYLCDLVPVKPCLNLISFYFCPSSNPGRGYCNYPNSYYCAYWGCETVASSWEPGAGRDKYITVGWGPFGCTPAHGIARGTCHWIYINVTLPDDRGWLLGKTWGMRYLEPGTDRGGLIVIKKEPIPNDPQPIGPNRVIANAVTVQNKEFANLREAIDKDLAKIERSINALETSLRSLSKVVLQNRRGLKLLLAQEGGLCVALNEKCCVYADHTGVVRDAMSELRKGLEERERERNSRQSWYERWFNTHPWLTTLLSTIAGPLVMLVLTLTFGSCIFSNLWADHGEAAVALEHMEVHREQRSTFSPWRTPCHSR